MGHVTPQKIYRILKKGTIEASKQLSKIAEEHRKKQNTPEKIEKAKKCLVLNNYYRLNKQKGTGY